MGSVVNRLTDPQGNGHFSVYYSVIIQAVTLHQYRSARTCCPEGSKEKYSAPWQCLCRTIRPRNTVHKTPYDEKWT